MRLYAERFGDPMHDQQMYIPPARAAETFLRQMSPQSRLVVTGQIGCGKTTLAKDICSRLGLSHLPIDDFHGDADPALSAARAASSIDGGWVAEANVWQIPDFIWESSDLAIFLDYPNIVHYLRIIRRCFRTCLSQPTPAVIRHTIGTEWGHMKIIYLYANKNREGWNESGGIANTTTPVIRSPSQSATNRLLACMDTTSRMQARADSLA